MKNFVGIISALIGLNFFISTAEGQMVFGQPPSGDARFIYQSWTIKDTAKAKTDLSQWVIPISVFVPVAENWEVLLTSSTAGSSLTSGDLPEARLSGLNDTRIAVYHALFEDRFYLGAGLNIPTGKKSLRNDEAGISEFLTESFLNMPIKSYGEGLGLNLEAGYVYKGDKHAFGLGSGYTLKGSYEPLKGITDYKPGDHFRLGGFGAISLNEIVIKLSGLFNFFGNDELNGDAAFRDGSMLDMRLDFGYLGHGQSAYLGIREIFRGKDKRVLSGVLESEPEKSHGTETRVMGQVTHDVRENLGLKLLAEYKRVAPNGYSKSDARYFGSSNYFGIGLGGDARIWKPIRISGEIEYFSGSADGGDLDLSGWQLSFGVRGTF